LGSWLGGQLLLMLIIGVATYLIVLIPGLFSSSYTLDDYALPIAIVAALFEGVPNLGPFMTMVFAVVMALGSSGIGAVVYVIVTFSLLQTVEANLVVPQILRKSVGTDPILSIIAIIAGFELGGVVGALLVIPILVVAKVIFEELVNTNTKLD
jgi:predicted PurR-regulated permease PerM